MSDASLNSAIRQFSGNGLGSVINQGTINTPEGGYVAFLGNMVSNQGSINTPLGATALGAGSAVTLTFDNNSLVQLQIDQSTLNNLAENKQLIKADGGMVIMSAGAKDSLLASVVINVRRPLCELAPVNPAARYKWKKCCASVFASKPVRFCV